MDRDTRYWLEQAQATAQNPGGWLYTADALKRSADLLLATSDEDRRGLVEAFSKGEWPALADELADIAGAPFLWPVYLQLAGLAIENLAKGIAIARDPTITEPDKGDRLFKWGHISANLFDQLEIPLDEKETALVDGLRVYVEWAGRYPVPRFALKLAGRRTFERTEDPASIDVLFERLRSELLAIAPAHEERGEQERQERGRQALQALSGLPKRLIDGATVFAADEQPVEPAAVVTCAVCQRTFTLAPNQPGGLCACGDFHWFELPYDGSLGRHIPMTEVLHSKEFDAGTCNSGPADEPNAL